MRLIDADKLIEEIDKKIDSKNWRVNDYMCGVCTGLANSIFLIEDAPTVFIPNAELDTTNDFGEWKPDGTCNRCGVYSSLNKDTTYFCPNCGSDNRKRVMRNE